MPQQNPAIFGEGLISKMTSLEMIFGIILEGKYEYSSISDLELLRKWINFQQSEGFFHESPFYSILNMERHLACLSCNPPSPSDYRKGRCGMFLKVDLSKKIAVGLHIGSTYYRVDQKLILVFYNYKIHPPPKKLNLGQKIIIMCFFASILNQSCSILSNLFGGQRWHPSWGQGHPAG